MADSIAEKYRPLLSAASFAARAHRHQLRKDRETPYIAHPFRVCLIVRHVFGIDDPEVLTAALLHDTVEDTTTDCDDLIEHFGPRVASWVAVLSKDKRLPDEQRESAYMEGLANAPLPVKLCKLADIFDNLMDSTHLSPAERRKTVNRSNKYLDCLDSNLDESGRNAMMLVRHFLADVATNPPDSL
jgi:guanosine-3',5'-bis(diphosphate) 3'-pyrophosphohydrolase